MRTSVRKFAWVLATALIISVVALVVLLSADNSQSAHPLRPDDAGVVAIGAKICEMHCASCHGANLQGRPDWRSRSLDGLLPAPPHDASGHTWHHDDETLFQITKLGVAKVIGDETYKTAMPVYANVLADEQIIAVLSWIKAQWPPETRKHNGMVSTNER